MFLDPTQLHSVAPAQILTEVANGRLDIDHRVLHALLDRPAETVPALVELAASDAWHDSPEIEIDIAQLFQALNASEGIPFLIEAVRRRPDEIADEVVEALHFFGAEAMEALLQLYGEMEEADSEEVAFLLSTFHIRDQRIFDILINRLEYSASEGAFLLGLYGDPAAKEHLAKLRATLGPQEAELRKEVDEALQLLESQSGAVHQSTPLDIYSRYPEEADLPIDLLPEEDRLALLSDERANIRAQAAHSFFNQHPEPKIVAQLLQLATTDENEQVRSRAAEALVDATEDAAVVEALLKRLRDPGTPTAEKASVLIGLSMETDRNEVRKGMEELYQNHPEARAKVLEAMWRSLHPAFRDHFAKHLDDPDTEVRRSALWGVGYYGVRTSLDKMRTLFDDPDLRSDAIFAYGLALPSDISKARAKSLLKRIEKDAGGLSELEERLAMTALDERFMLAGKEPVFFPED
jgi:HEAT repeat protein